MKITRDYQARDIHCNLQKIKIKANKQALVDVNESHLNLLHVHNIDVNWKCLNSNQRIYDAKIEWEK